MGDGGNDWHDGLRLPFGMQSPPSAAAPPFEGIIFTAAHLLSLYKRAHLYAAPLHVGIAQGDCGGLIGRFRIRRTEGMRHVVYGVRRITLPRRWVNGLVDV